MQEIVHTCPQCRDWAFKVTKIQSEEEKSSASTDIAPLQGCCSECGYTKIVTVEERKALAKRYSLCESHILNSMNYLRLTIDTLQREKAPQDVITQIKACWADTHWALILLENYIE